MNPRHRQLYVIAGPEEWSRREAVRFLGGNRAVWLGNGAPEGEISLAMNKAAELLGGEQQILVFDAHSGFDPDGFGAVSGTVMGGGALILLTPPLDEWGDFDDPQHQRIAVHGTDLSQIGGRFLWRLAQAVQRDGSATIFTPESPAQGILSPISSAACLIQTTEDQTAAIDAVVRVAMGHRRRPVTLIADRGRGKSTAMGMAAAEVLKQGRKRVLITAPRVAAVEFLLSHAASRLDGAERRGSTIRWHDATIEYFPPDELLRNSYSSDLLLVDEAAAIPAPLLEGLLQEHARIAFSTTVHGYEGSGRGFAIRFRKTLDEITPQWREYRLTTPVRWAEGDPLERFVFDALLLNAEPAPVNALSDAEIKGLSVKPVEREALVRDEPCLRELFGLLVSAHYRTTPFDLRYMLDGPNISVWTSEHGGRVVAAALVAEEGGFEESLLDPVWLGQRRPHGHLLPQTLSAHAGLRDAPELRYHRVIRIAIHPELQGRGIGSRVLNRLSNAATEQGADFIGSSFGLTTELLSFWKKAGTTPVRVGSTRDASSGCHSVVMLNPLTPAANSLFQKARQRFLTGFADLLSEPLADLEPELAAPLIRGMDSSLPSGDSEDLHAFAYGRRDYADCLPALRHFAIHALSQEGGTDIKAVVVYKILQRKSWTETARLLGLPGKKQVMEELRTVVREVSE